MKHIVLICFLFSSTLYITGCETDEDNAMLKAQACFNKKRDGDSAADCLAMIAGFSSPEANTLKCGMTMFEGGVNTGAITDAFDLMEAAPEADKESTLMLQLVMGSVGEAEVAYGYCRDSGSAGLLYISTLSRMATVMDDIASGASSPDELVDSCKVDAGTCQETIGILITDMAGVYCIGASATNEVCTTALAAIAAGGGPQSIGQFFLNQIDPMP
jgi:hypothetical protein